MKQLGFAVLILVVSALAAWRLWPTGPVVAESGNPLADTDARLAMGRYDEAMQMLDAAIGTEPDRVDLKLKRIEVLFVLGDAGRLRAAVAEHESELRNSGKWDWIEQLQQKLDSRAVSLLPQADEHLAYGQFAQAAELISSAVAAEPRRTDLKMKLFEVYFIAGDNQNFEAAARRWQRELSEAGEWDKIRIMGTQLDPANELFR